MTPFEPKLLKKIEDALKEPLERLHGIIMEATQQSSGNSDPVDFVTSSLIGIAVEMLRGYRPEESAEEITARVQETVASVVVVPMPEAKEEFERFLGAEDEK